MGDAGEGLIDAESRIQERMEELERERSGARRRCGDATRGAEGARVARVAAAGANRAVERQLDATTHERRRAQIAEALAEVDRRMAEVSAVIPV